MGQIPKLLRKKILNSLALLVSLAMTLNLGAWNGVALAGSATLSLSPGSGSVARGSTITVGVRVNTSDPVNAVQANLTYPADKLDFVSISASGSAFEIAAQGSGGGGGVQIGRGTTGSVTGNKLVASIIFRARTNTGTASVTFNGDSQVVRSTDNQNILSGTSGGNYTLTNPAPVAPTPQAPPPDTTAPVISEVKVSEIGPRSATIEWKTNEDSSSIVEFGRDTNYGLVNQAEAKTKDHKLALQSNLLLPGASFHFKVKSVDAAGNTGSGEDGSFELPGYTAEFTVVDQKNKPVKGAKVTFITAEDSAQTDNQGKVSFDKVQPGRQAIAVEVKGRIQNFAVDIADKGIDDPANALQPQAFSFSVEVPKAKLADYWVIPILILLGALIFVFRRKVWKFLKIFWLNVRFKVHRFKINHGLKSAEPKSKLNLRKSSGGELPVVTIKPGEPDEPADKDDDLNNSLLGR